MKKGILFILMICLSALNTFSQITKDNVTVETIGLSEEYASIFKDSKNVMSFVSAWNSLDIVYDVDDIKITVLHNDNFSTINVSLDYNSAKHQNLMKYKRHCSEFESIVGDGISVLLQTEIMTAITEYKYAVASNGWTIDSRIMNFVNAVTFNKSNGDTAVFTSYNYLKNNGAFPLILNDKIELLLNKKLINVFSENTKLLNDFSFFKYGEKKGLDGKPTSSYYLSEFFTPTKKEVAEVEAEQKAKAQREALLKAEIERNRELLKNECLTNLVNQINTGLKLDMQLLSKNNCFIDDYNNVICRTGEIEVAVGKIEGEYIRYVGGSERILDLLNLIDSKGDIVINTKGSELSVDTILNIFDYKAKKIVLFDTDESNAFIDTKFQLKIRFKPNRYRNISNELRLKVQEKKGSLKYTMSIPYQQSVIYKKYENECILNALRGKNIAPGTYYFKMLDEPGTIHINSSYGTEESFSCRRYTLTSNDNKDIIIICYDKFE